MSGKAMQLAGSNGYEVGHSGWDQTHVMTTEYAAARAYKEADIQNPREEISMMEVHDCFSVTELVTYEDLLISERGQGWRDFLDGVFNRDGQVVLRKN